MFRKYNFNSIGDLLDYREYLKSEIKRCEKWFYFCPIPGYIIYIETCYNTLKLINYLIKKKGYNV